MSKLWRHLSSSSCFPEITGIKWAVFIISDNCKRYGLPVTVGDTLIKSDQTNNTPSSCLDLTVSRTCRFTTDDKESGYSNHCCFGRSIKNVIISDVSVYHTLSQTVWRLGSRFDSLCLSQHFTYNKVAQTATCTLWQQQC